MLTIPLVAQAIIPQSTIHACVNASGVLQITEIAEECNGQSEALSWNSQGIPGTDGADGVDGTNGVDGVDGVDGTDGVDGVSGYEVVRVIAQGYTVPGVPAHLTVIVTCPAGSKAAGGGGFTAVSGALLTDTYPGYGNDGQTWATEFDIPAAGGGFVTIQGYATCINV